MAFKEALFWVGLTIFGTGLYFTVEKGNVNLPYAIALMIIGFAALAYPVIQHHYPQAHLPAIRAWVPLLVVSWAVFGYDVYLKHAHPKIVEKIVEKPVEKVVEKQTQVPCPTPTATTKKSPPKAIPQQSAQNQQPTQSCPNGICNAGDNLGTQSVNNFGPPPPNFKFTEEAGTPLAGDGNLKVLKIHIKTDRPVPGAVVGVVMSGPIEMTPESWERHKPSLAGAMEQQISVAGPLTLGNGYIANSFSLIVQMPSAFTEYQELTAEVVSKEEVHVVKVVEVGRPYK